MSGAVCAQTPRMDLPDLPECVLIDILDNLSTRDIASAAQTSSGWRNKLYQPFFWRGRRARLRLDYMRAAVFRSLSHRGLRDVQIISCRNLKKLSKFLCRVLSVRTLDLRMLPALSKQDLETVFSKLLPKLRELSLSLEDGFPSKTVCDRIGNLQVLKLYKAREFNFRDVVRCLPRLRKLKIVADCSCMFTLKSVVLSVIRRPLLTQLCLEDVVVELEDMKNLSKGLTNLKSLCIRVCSRNPGYDALVQNLAKMSSLEELRLVCYRHGGEAMQLLRNGLPNLRLFHFHPSVDITETEALCLQQMSNLTELVLKNATDTTIRCVSRGLGIKLKRLSLSGRKVTDCGIRFVATMTGLQDLSLLCTSITHVGFGILQNGLTALRSLDLRSEEGKKLTCKSVTHIANMASLRDLRLHRFHMEAGAMKILRGGSAPLVYVNLWLCETVSKEDLGVDRGGCKVACKDDPLFPPGCCL